MSINEIVLSFDSGLPFLLTVVFFVGVKAFRQNTSLTVIAVVLALAEFSMHSIRDPLWGWAHKNSAINYEIRLMGWFGCWIICDLIVLKLLHRTHEWLNITKTKEVKVIQSAYLSLAVFHLIAFSNRTGINVKLIDYMYQFGVPIINLSVALFLLIALLRKTVNVNFKIALRHNHGD